MSEEKRGRGRPPKEPRVKRTLAIPKTLDAAMLDAADRAGKTPHAFMLEAVANASGMGTAAEPPTAPDPEPPAPAATRPAREKAKPKPKAQPQPDLTPEPARGIVTGISLPLGQTRGPTQKPGRK